MVGVVSNAIRSYNCVFLLIFSVCVYNFAVNVDLNHAKVVYPPSLKVGVSTATVSDNINHNPMYNIATNSFHGKAILLF